MTTISKAPCPMCGGPRDSEVYVCPKCRYVPVSFSMPTIMQNQFDDAYWLRVFAGHLASRPVSKCAAVIVVEAYEILEEIKKREKEK